MPVNGMCRGQRTRALPNSHFSDFNMSHRLLSPLPQVSQLLWGNQNLSKVEACEQWGPGGGPWLSALAAVHVSWGSGRLRADRTAPGATQTLSRCIRIFEGGGSGI